MRRYVGGCPNENFAWRFYGQLDVVTEGSYNLCITSDDGSMLYIDLTPGDKVRNLRLPLTSLCLARRTRQYSAQRLAGYP